MSDFIHNKYRRWYFEICDRARGRNRDIGMERHHVLPKSLGGDNTSENLVYLTYREHFLAHWLLTKFTAGNDKRKMNYALAMMARNHGPRVITSWQYARAKVARIAAFRGRKISEQTRSRMSATARNRSPEYRAKQSVAHTGRKLTAETRAKLSIATKNIDPSKRAEMAVLGGLTRRGRKHSAETISKMVGRVVSAGTREKLRVLSTGNSYGLGTKRSADSIAKMSAGIKAAWAKPDVRAKQSAAIRESLSSPEARARKSAAAKKSWAKRKAGNETYA